MKRWRYSRWDGAQPEFSLDAEQALDALSELLMEGLGVDESLEWLRQSGFELAGMDFRVMGVEELLRELQQQARELLGRYDLRAATSDLAQRFEALLQREERAQREAHGLESDALGRFLARRHGEYSNLSDAIEAFRGHDFADAEAGQAFRELLGELERLRALEEFLRQRGEDFHGGEAADYESAQQIREQFEQLKALARALREGDFESISPEALREWLSEQGAQSVILLRDLGDALRDAGYLRGEEGAQQLTPRAIRRIGARALAAVYAALRAGRPGGHDTRGRGIAMPRPDETRPWQFGDALELHIVRTLLNGVLRRAQSAAAIRAGRAPGARLELERADLEVCESDFNTQTTTVLLLDMSWSMSWAGRFPAAKRVALALDHLIRSRYPRDDFFVVGFSTRARELNIRQLPLASWDMGDPFTNLQEGLLLAERLIARSPSPSPQLLLITDGQPTAYFSKGQLRVEWPSGFGGVSPRAVAETLRSVRRLTRRGITINTFMLDDSPELVGFVERMTEINRGRAFFTSPGQLGSFLTLDYLSRRRASFR